VAARGRESDQADLEPLGLAQEERARRDRVVEADVLRRPDAVEPGALGGVDGGSRVAAIGRSP
jgi:hypothetical protein